MQSIRNILLKRALRLILQENSFQFNGKNCLQTHGTAVGTKMAVAFFNIFMNKVETQILSQSLFKPLVWKRYIDDIFSLWTTNRDRGTQRQFLENICSVDDLTSRIFGTFVVKFLACLPLLGFSNI